MSNDCKKREVSVGCSLTMKTAEEQYRLNRPVNPFLRRYSFVERKSSVDDHTESRSRQDGLRLEQEMLSSVKGKALSVQILQKKEKHSRSLRRVMSCRGTSFLQHQKTVRLSSSWAVCDDYISLDYPIYQSRSMSGKCYFRFLDFSCCHLFLMKSPHFNPCSNWFKSKLNCLCILLYRNLELRF